MRFFTLPVLSVLCTCSPGLAATTTATEHAKSTVQRKRYAPKVCRAKKARHPSSPKKASAPKASPGKTPPAATWRTRQQAPTSDRYKEIQQALVDKGYLKGEPTGVWDADSAAAMQRFQQDQKLTPSGKINAPSLIGLGLGAKSAGAPEAAPIKQEAAPIKQEALPVAPAAPSPPRSR